jgi:hypothetical protein
MPVCSCGNSLCELSSGLFIASLNLLTMTGIHMALQTLREIEVCFFPWIISDEVLMYEFLIASREMYRWK